MSNKYFDVASGSYVEYPIIRLLLSAYEEYWKNPSSFSAESAHVKFEMEQARGIIANYIGADPSEIIFTSCATESNNLAIKGFMEANYEEFGVFLTSTTEHPSVYNVAMHLKNEQICHVDFIDSPYGQVDVQDLCNKLDYYSSKIDGSPYDSEYTEHCLVSTMFVNNELGTINPIKQISSTVHGFDGILHVDAAQAFGRIPINVKELGIDMMTFSFSKIGMPKGLACLYIKNGLKVNPILDGGGQEFGIRSGTENAPMIIVAKSIVENLSIMQAIRNKWVGDANEYLINRLTDAFYEYCKVECTVPKDIPTASHIISMRFKGFDAQEIITALGTRGYQVSAGSACSSGDLEPSRILINAGLSPEEAKEVIRISIDHTMDNESIDNFISELKTIIYLLVHEK